MPFLIRLTEHDAAAHPRVAPTSVSFDTLAHDLQSVWSAPITDARLSKRIVHTVIHETLADIDERTAEIVPGFIGWAGPIRNIGCPAGDGDSASSTPADMIEAVRVLKPIANEKDDVIAGILNRNGLKNGNGNRRSRERVTSMRSSHRVRIHRRLPQRDAPALGPRLQTNHRHGGLTA